MPRKNSKAIIRSTGFFRNKAKNIRAMAAKLVAEHWSKVPRSLDALAALPGVGRKTANVVLGNAFASTKESSSILTSHAFPPGSA